MDIISHGLWGGVAFGKKSKWEFWLAFFIGMAPDFFSFGIYTIATILGISEARQSYGQTDMNEIPQYVHALYNVTHSLVIFLIVFGLLWAIRRKPLWLLGAWGLHILVDIPTHAASFFPTPFLWPVSSYTLDGINWGNPYIFFSNLGLLLVTYLIWFLSYKKPRTI